MAGIPTHDEILDNDSQSIGNSSTSKPANKFNKTIN